MKTRLVRLLALFAIVLACAAFWWAAFGFASKALAQSAELVRVNDEVNRSIRYVSDRDQYGVEDWWMADPVSGMGDCEDYALTKQARVGGEVVVVTYRGQRHAVLVVDGWVLDNIERRVVPLDVARRYYRF